MAPTTPVTEEEAAAMAKDFTKGITNKKTTGEGKKAERPKPIVMRLRSKPAWIKYYERSSTGATDYGRGYAKPYEFFEEQIMKEYTNSADQFLDLINQNPEACAILYPDASGKIRILHHLTATVNSHAILIGVEGLGGTSEAKAITISTLSDQLSIGLMDGKNVVPKVKDFMEQSFGDITPGLVSTGLDRVPDDELGNFFDGFPTGYMIHPLWLTLLYEAIGQGPTAVADTLMGNLEMAFHEERAGFDEYSSLSDYYSEVHKLLVYLWGCKQGHITLTNRCIKFLTKTFEAPNKLAAEGTPAEIQIVLGWEINTRTLMVSLSKDKFLAWQKDVETTAVTGVIKEGELDSLVGQLNHAAFIIPLSRHFLGRLRKRLRKRTWKSQQITLSGGETDDLKIWGSTFLPMARDGVSMNLMTHRHPDDIGWSDTCLYGGGGFHQKGQAWRFRIPPTSPLYRDKIANNFLEFLGMAVNVYIMTLQPTQPSQ